MINQFKDIVAWRKLSVFWGGSLLLVCSLNLHANVIINEISARASEHLLRYSESGLEGVPRLGTGVVWTDLSYDDSFWVEHQARMGYDTGEINTDLGLEMRDITPSLYVRKTFTVSSEIVSLEEIVTLFIEYDDGFVAYLNGKEIARGNTGPLKSFVYREQEAYNQHTSDGFEAFALIGNVAEHLVEGENVLAIQIHNHNMASGFKFDAKLSYKGTNPLGGKFDKFLIEKEEIWKTLVGVVEPSGGMFDPGLLGSEHFDGNFVDWIELYNDGDLAVDLTGWTLADSGDQLPWRFPNGTTIEAGGFLVVIADSLGGVEGIGELATYIHTNFSLSGDGEYLALANDSGVIQSEFNDYPKQDYFHSYGVSPVDGTLVYFSEPTPGVANTGSVFSGFVKEPKFNQSGGFHDAPIDLAITSATVGASIRYTTDGSEPTLATGTLYEGAITIGQVAENRGTVIRVRAFKEGMIASNLRTRTFLIGQHEALKTLPAVIITGDRERSIYSPNGVTAIHGGTYEDRENLQFQWFTASTDDYNLPIAHGREVERPASLEVRYPDGSPGFHINMGLRIAGSDHSRKRYRFSEVATRGPDGPGTIAAWDKDRIPWDSSVNENRNYPAFTRKPSFNFVFRSEYDKDSILDFPLFPDSKFTEFPTLRLRGGKNDPVNLFIKDELARRLYLDMGGIGAAGIITSAYVNGDFKGHYNLVERLKEAFFQQRYNSAYKWDIRERDGATEGDLEFYNEWVDFLDLNQAESTPLTPQVDLAIKENYERLQDFIDIENYIDYLLINIWFVTLDWPQNNYFIARERSPEGRMRFYLWDVESSLNHNDSSVFTASYDALDDSGRIQNPRTVSSKDHPITYLWRGLKLVPDFRLHFADRIQKHFQLSDSALREENLTARYEELRNQYIDIFNYVHGPEEAFDENRVPDWIRDRQLYLFNSDKSGDDQFANAGVWYREAGEANEILKKTPAFNQLGGNVPVNYPLKISMPGGIINPFDGTIYVTLDGSDPRTFGGDPNPDAIIHPNNGTINLTESMTVKARARSKDGAQWSVLIEGNFFVGILPSTDNLVVTEIMYRPMKPSAEEVASGFLSRSDFEYIEIMNIGSDRVELDNVRFTEGIVFAFDNTQYLNAGARMLLVSNRSAFAMRYGENEAIGGVFEGNLGRNDQIHILDAFSSTIRDFTYDSSGAWPEGPDGDGYSLVLMQDPASNPGELSNPSSWRTSSLPGGSPGEADRVSISRLREQYFSHDELSLESISGDNADPDHDGMTNLLELALASDLRNAGDMKFPITEVIQVDVETGLESFLTLSYCYRPGNDDFNYTIEVSDDLITWADVGDQETLVIKTEDRGDGSIEVTVRDSVPVNSKTSRYIRLVVSEKSI